ncbi:MAG: transporter [Gammaproteobacteria bacterium]|nr:transporter [Gammaproteobacteria bacterium]
MSAQQFPSQNTPRYLILVASLVAVGLSLFQLWQPLVGFFPVGSLPFESVLGQQPATYFRPIHLSWVLVLGFLVYPLGREGGPARWLDGAVIALVLWASARILIFDYQSIEHLLNGLQAADFSAGLVLVIATLEMARRAVGAVMMWVGLIFLLYAAFGNILPDVLATKGFSFERIIRFQVFTGAGLFGAPLGIAAGAVFSFVLFGAFLQVTGAGKFLIDLSFAAAGRYRGGPAKASVIASAAMGSISGSAIANTVTTGSLTIPMMKKLGYKPEEAAGIEAAASTGGQIMPPIMGAGAFVMAEFTKTSYGDIVWMALVPALLYFLSVLLYVHVLAVKGGFKGMQGQTGAWRVLVDGLHFLLPLALITTLLLWNYSPVLVGVAGSGAVLLASLLRSQTRIGFAQLIEGLRQGAMLAVSISVACAVAGLVVGTIGQTGIGLQFTESVVALSGGQLWLALILVAVAALVLGMGLPATAAYIVLAVMTGPALQELGLALITAHMIIFWLAQSSNVTPPIALAAFAGAGVAGAAPMRSAVEAVKLASGLFVIPLMMAFSPLLLSAEFGWTGVFVAALVTGLLMLMLVMVLQRHLFVAVSRAQQVLALVAAGLLVYPSYLARIVGICLALAIMLANRIQPSRIH